MDKTILPIVVLSYASSVEEFDTFSDEQTTNIVLSSLNGVDRSTKRICRIELMHDNSEQTTPIEVIIPTDRIPTPNAQSMRGFKLFQKSKTYKKWIGDVTQEDLGTLPIILVGLNYLKLFPIPIPKEKFGRLLRAKCPDISFYTSNFTGKTLAAGVYDQKIDDNEIVNRVYDYQELSTETPLFPPSAVNVSFIPSKNSEDLKMTYDNTTSNIDDKKHTEEEMATLNKLEDVGNCLTRIITIDTSDESDSDYNIDITDNEEEDKMIKEMLMQDNNISEYAEDASVRCHNYRGG